MLIPVRSEHVSVAWPLAEPHIRAACRRGPLPCDAEDLRDACEAGRHQLWIAECEAEVTGAAVTGVLNEPQGRVCVWIAMGGTYAALEFALPLIEDWARDEGCIAMRSFSRVGMVRRVPSEYRAKGVILERML